MRKETFFINSVDGKKIFTMCRLPDKGKNIKAIVQISHGMAEHSARYEEFAEVLTGSGIGVYANDHRGHGRTAGSIENVGFFAEKNGWELVVDDMHLLTKEINKSHPNVPFFLFGHSMGSFLSRDYVTSFGNEVDGLILSGTAADPGPLGYLGIFISKLSGQIFGKRSKSYIMDKLSFVAFNGKFKPNRTRFDWLSRDEEQVDKYIIDPYCGGVFSAGFFYDMLRGIKKIHKKKNIDSVPEFLPMFFISGEKDPVGNNTRGVKKVIDMYVRSGIKNIDFKFYPNARHEILNEINREEVYEDITNWIGEKLLDIK